MHRPLAAVLMLVLVPLTSLSQNRKIIAIGSITRLEVPAEEAAKSAEKLKKRCEEIAFLLAGHREPCREAVTAHEFTAEAAEFCSQASDHELVRCLKAVEGRRFAREVFEACGELTSASSKRSDRATCLQYFSVSKSAYDLSAVRLCFQKSTRSFDQSLPCMNAVRGRDVTAEVLKEKCEEPTGFAGLNSSGFVHCFDRVAIEAPTLGCAPDARLVPAVKNPTTTEPGRR